MKLIIERTQWSSKGDLSFFHVLKTVIGKLRLLFGAAGLKGDNIGTVILTHIQHRVTYKSRGRSTQTDSILCRRGRSREIRDCKVVAGESVAKQHPMVVCKIMMKMEKEEREDRAENHVVGAKERGMG